MDVNVVRREGDDLGPLEIQFAQDYEFDYTVEVDREPPTLSSVQVTIRQGSTLFVDAQAATVSGDQFTFTFLKADQPPDPIEALISEWTIKFGTEEFIFQEILDVVRTPLTVPIKEIDLFTLFPQLRDARRLGLEEGLPESGTTTTLVALQLAGYEDGFYVGGELEIIDGPAAGEWRRIITFDGTTGTVTVENAFSTAITVASQFRIRRSWQPLIAEAWAQMRERIRNRGNRSALIMDSQAFRTGLLYVAGGLCFGALSMGNLDDPMQVLADINSKEGWQRFEATEFLYDESDSGDPSGDLKVQVAHVPRR